MVHLRSSFRFTIRLHLLVRVPNELFGNRIRLCFRHELLPLLVDSFLQQNNLAPSLHVHYRRFTATTSQSAPVPRIGTQVLVGLPLRRLPFHRGDRFPGYTHEPETDSRHLYAGRRSGSKRIPPELIPD